MSQFTLRISFTMTFLLVVLSSFSQHRDSMLHYYYTAEENTVLDLDFEHTNLNILPSENDTIAIHTYIGVIPSNPNAPKAGITVENYNQGTKYIRSSIAIGEEIQPHNKLKIRCEIHIPENLYVKLKSRYGIINVNAHTGTFDTNLAYSNLTVNTITQDAPYTIIADFSTIVFSDTINNLSINGKNANITAKHIGNLKSNTEFSVFNVATANTVKAQSYTDKFIIGETDSMIISSKKSLCLLENLNLFFQGEMEKGSLTIKDIAYDFEAINISNSYTKSQLNFNKNCNFSLNADMRYCLLKQEQLTLQEIVSPNSILYNGTYGESEKRQSNLSIISAYGDVSLRFK